MSKPVNTIVQLAATQKVTLPAEGSARAWLMLLPAGTFSARDGRGPFTTGDQAAMQRIVDATLAWAGATELMVDYDHQAMNATNPRVGGTARAAGWVKSLEVRADGIWGEIEWTEAAATAIRANEYRYLSPVFSHDKAGAVAQLVNIALVNMPAVDLMATAASFQLNQEVLMKKITAKLGLEETASEDAIVTAIEAMQAERAKIVTAAGLDVTATGDQLVSALATARAVTPDPAKFVPVEQVSKLQADFTALQLTLTTEKAEQAVAQAVTDGKLPPALKDWGLKLAKTDMAQFSAYVAGAPKITATQTPKSTVPDGDPALTPEDEATITRLGLDRAAFIAQRKLELSR